MKEKINKLKKIKLNHSLKRRLVFAILILVMFLFVLISYLKTYSDYITRPGSNIDGGVVYINDYASDYYYYKGMKYVGDIEDNTVNYNDNNLVPVTINYHGHADGVNTCDNDDYNNCGYVSLTEKQYKFVYYKYFPVESGYINIELIENPFASRPFNKAFNGWVASSGTLSKNNNTKIQSLRLPVTYTNGIPNSIEVNLYASWVEANVIWLDAVEGDDNFDGSFDDPVGSWGKAFQLLRANATDVNDREKNIIVLKTDIENSINYTRPLTHTWDTTISYTDNTTFNSGETYILEYLNGNNRYALIDNNGNVGYNALSTETEPNDNAKWIITSVDSGYTIQNADTNRYLSYSVSGLNVDLTLSNTAAVWSYDSTNRYFYVELTTTGISYNFTHNNSFTNGQTYRITRVIGEQINALNFQNNTTINNQVLASDTTISNNSGFIINTSGSGYTIRNTYNNYYLTGVEGDNTGELSESTSNANGIWNYDSANQSFYKDIRVTTQATTFTYRSTIATGQFYLTTGEGDEINAIGRNGTAVTNFVLEQGEEPSENCLVTISRSGSSYRLRINGSYLRIQNGSLRFGNQTANWTYSNGIFSSTASYTTYYLSFSNGTWSIVNSSANATRVYLTTIDIADVTQNVTHYLSYDNGWTLKQAQDETTKLTFTSVIEEEITETNDFYIYYNSGFSLEKDNHTSLNFATYEMDRRITDTSMGAISTNSYYTSTTNVAATITSLYNGIDYRNNATISLTSAGNGRATINAYADLQLEYLTVAANGYDVIDNGSASTSYINSYANLLGNYKNVRIGRGMTPLSWTDDNSTIFCFVSGAGATGSLGSSSNDNNEYRFTIESGRYSGIMGVRNRNATGNNNTGYNFYGTMELTLGNDYDRAIENNDNMDVYYRTASSNNYGLVGKNDSSIPAYLMRVKSGKYGVYFFENNANDTTKAYAGIYVGGLTVSASNTTTDISNRVLVVEGGKVANIIGGLRLAQSYVDDVKTKIYVKGGVVSNIVGGAGVSTTYGDRYISVTGGEIEYSVSGGSNGYLATSSTGQDNGQLAGDSYVHIGGNSRVGTAGSGDLYYVAYGSVLGAGNGNEDIGNSGRVNYTNLFVSEEAVIEGSLYGGGNFGNVVNNVKIQIDGGKINGSVYGGPNQNGVGTVNINSTANTTVVYTDSDNFRSGLKYIIANTTNGRNALSANNIAVTNATLNTTTSPGSNVNWLITDVGNGYTLKNDAGIYLGTKPGTGSASLMPTTSAEEAIWQYNDTVNSFHKTESVITSSQVTYTANTSFNSGSRYIITNANSGTMNALTGGTAVSTSVLSTTVLPNEATGWIIAESGSGYTIQNASNGNYLSNNGNSLQMTEDPTIWSYDVGNRRFYIEVDNWLWTTTYYIRYYNNAWSLNTSAANATSLYFVTYTAVNQTAEYDYYLNYNNGWTLTTNTASVNELVFTQFSDSTILNVTATNKSYGNVTINMTGGEIANTLYGGSCLLGNVAGLVDINITGGTINKNGEHGGSVFGGGYGESTYVASGVNLDIVDNTNDININGTVYGGSAFGTVVGDINVNVIDNNTAKVITLNDDLYCGSMGDGADSSKGNITGGCTLTVKGGNYPNSVYGGNNANGSAYGEILVTIGGDNVKTTISNVYGGGNQADSLATSNKVYILSDSNITNAFGGGNEALVDVTYLYLNGGRVVNAYGGSNVASLTTSNVYLNGATATNIFGGSNESGDVASTNIMTTSGTATNIYGGNNLGGFVQTSNVTINGGTIESTYGGGNLAEVNSTNVIISNGKVTNAFGGGNEAGIVNDTDVDINGGTITNIYGGSNQSGNVPTSDITVTLGTIDNIYGGNNLGGKTDTSKININGGNIKSIYGGGNLAEVSTTNIDVTNGTITNIYGGGNQAGITNNTNINISGGTTTKIFGGSNQSGDVPVSNILVTGGNAGNVYGGNNAGGTTIATNVIINGGNASDIYGGGNEATSNITYVSISNGNVTGSVYGGGNQAGILTDATVKIKDSNVSGNVFGGGNFGTVSRNTIVDIENSNITLSAYAGGNGQSAVVHGDTAINIHGNSVIGKHVFGGGNAANTGTEQKDNSSGTVNITGGKINGNVYGAANTAKLYGKTTVNIGYDAVINVGGTPVGVTYNNTLGAYENNSGRITMNSAFINTTGNYNNSFLSVQNLLTETITDYNLVVYTGSNEVSACYNCTYETKDGYTTFKPRTDLGFSLNADGSYDLQGTWSLNNPSEIYVVGYYTEEVTDPVLVYMPNYSKADIDIGGTVFGGGEANASGSEEYDFTFISVTTGIIINIDGAGHDNFDIHQSIFGSGNASSTTGYSYVYIDNYGKINDIKQNVSIQRANLVEISNSHIDLLGATDRTNEFSEVLFTLSRIDELKLKNNSSLYLKTGANLLKKFRSLVDDENGNEQLATVTINKDTKTVTKNVDNRLYVVENKNLNIATNETATAYGEVDGMTFFGMYRYDREGNIVTAMYDPSYKYGDSPDTGDLYYFSSGTYVLGMHEENHNIEVDGFYSNFEDKENIGKIIVDYIVPTPESSSFYMWSIGVQVISYDITLTASKYATLGTHELQLINYPDPNIKFSIVGFSYDELDTNVSLVDPNTIPKIAPDDFSADNNLGLSVRTGTSGWITIGESTFLTDSVNLWEGTTDYNKENSSSAPSLIFYLHHSKNIKSDANLGTVVISMIAVIPVDELTNRIERININVTLTRALYTTNNYEGAMIPGREYQLFSSSKTDITSTSSLSAYFSLFIDSDKEVYKTGYHHSLVSSFVLPLNTKITMIDFASSEEPKYYYYIINQDDVNDANSEFSVQGEASYDLSKFIRMGSLSTSNRYNDALMNEIYYDENLKVAVEEFIFIVDFKESGITENKLGNTLMIELRDADDETLYPVLGIQHSSLTYNLYSNKDAIIEVEGALNKETVYLGDTAQLTVTTNFLQQTNTSLNPIYDTNYHDNKLGIEITFIDQNGNQVNGADMMGINFTLNGVVYHPRSDGSVRINLAERVANVESKILINTANCNLANGNYQIYIKSFYSADGIYYGLNTSDTTVVGLKFLQKMYGLEAIIDAGMAIIDKETGLTSLGSRDLLTTIKYDGGLSEPNIRLAMYRRGYETVYDTTYNLVDINDYLMYPLNSSGEENIYMILQPPVSSQSLILNFKNKLISGTYKLEFRLYDGDAYIGEVSKYIIIR